MIEQKKNHTFDYLAASAPLVDFNEMYVEKGNGEREGRRGAGAGRN